mgnify:FL=1
MNSTNNQTTRVLYFFNGTPCPITLDLEDHEATLALVKAKYPLIPEKAGFFLKQVKMFEEAFTEEIGGAEWDSKDYDSLPDDLKKLLPIWISNIMWLVDGCGIPNTENFGYLFMRTSNFRAGDVVGGTPPKKKKKKLSHQLRGVPLAPRYIEPMKRSDRAAHQTRGQDGKLYHKQLTKQEAHILGLDVPENKLKTQY